MTKLKTIDLFAGMGGVRLAFEKAGFHTVFANDFEEKCRASYDTNSPEVKLTVDDIRNIDPADLPNFDLLLGGFPCQPFSVAGERKGLSDERGTLFLEIAEILKERKPVGFFLENVKNLKGHDFGRTFKRIMDELDICGYEIKHAILNSMEYGNVPQNRERVYIVGFRKETKLIDSFTFPLPMKLTKTIDDILLNENEVETHYYYDGKPLFERIKNTPFEKGRIYQWRRGYVRENKSGVCPTLTANMGTGGHNVPIIRDDKGIRKLTPRECARIQGFPDSYNLPKMADSYLYKQIGNSVSVPVVYRIARQMMIALCQ